MHSVPINFGWHARRHSYHVHNSFFWYFCCSFNEVKYNNRNQLWSWNKLLDKTKSDAECSYIGRLSRSLEEKVTNVNCIENNNRIICKWLISMSSTATNLCCVFIRSEICCMHLNGYNNFLKLYGVFCDVLFAQWQNMSELRAGCFVCVSESKYVSCRPLPYVNAKIVWWRFIAVGIFCSCSISSYYFRFTGTHPDIQRKPQWWQQEQ